MKAGTVLSFRRCKSRARGEGARRPSRVRPVTPVTGAGCAGPSRDARGHTET